LSGRDLINDMRSGTPPPPETPGRGGVTDMILVAVAVMAIGAVGYFGLGALLGGGSPAAGPGPAAAVAKAMITQAAWTSDDADRCLAKARAVANSDIGYQPAGDGMSTPNPAVAEGYAGLATLLECHMTLKPARFCDPAQRSALVSEINDFLGRSDLVMAGMAVEGAPMKIAGGLFGGEMSAGSEIYDMEHEATIQLMKTYGDKIVVALRKLARDGLISPADFSSFLTGPSENIKRMFGATAAERNVCA